MPALPLNPAVGVKTAVRVVPVPLIAPSVPPTSATSLSSKLAPGFSLNAKLIVAVWPMPSALALLLIASVGATVSTLIARLPADPRLPESSV